jgi:hypothetical protein
MAGIVKSTLDSYPTQSDPITLKQCGCERQEERVRREIGRTLKLRTVLTVWLMRMRVPTGEAWAQPDAVEINSSATNPNGLQCA